jgi:hypothetical protein
MLRFTVQVEGRTTYLDFDDPAFVLCGFTGRDPEEVQAHIRELEQIGVAKPRSTPVFMRLPGWLLTQPSTPVEVATPDSSGEAEPVLLRTPEGRLFLTVGSDHTDRVIEASSIIAGKLACPKPLATEAWPLDDVIERWNDLVLTGGTRRDGSRHTGRLTSLTPPDALLSAMERVVRVPEGRGLVMFLGTVAGADAVPAGDESFVAGLADGVTGRSIECTYFVEDLSTALTEAAA